MVTYPPFQLTSSQSGILNAIFDTFLAELTPQEEATLIEAVRDKEGIYEVSTNQASTLSKLSATSLNITPIVSQFIENYVEPAKRHDLLRVLNILATRPGSLLLTGYWHTIDKLSREQREQVLLGWKTSYFHTLRGLYSVLAALCLFNAYNKKHSPLIEAVGSDNCHGDRFFETHPDYKPVQRERIPMMTTAEATKENLEFDVIIVGSGAGGGVVAAELAKAGHSVLVIEKGKYYHQSEIVHEEEAAFANLYDGAGPIASTNGSIQCLAGATFGGGTAVNYLASLKLQSFVREEWVELGLSHFASPQFNEDLERVFERIGASTENVFNGKTRRKFVSGCTRLGYPIETVHVNTGGKPHHCHMCNLGCKSGIKNSTANTWLLDAKKHGAKFLDRTPVTRILKTDGGKQTIGIECRVHDSQVFTTIKAKKVIISCGSLRTPNLLRKSGLVNSHIGQHLRLQPIGLCFGVFDETIKQNEGPLLTSLCKVSDNCQGDHYGAKIEEGTLQLGGLANNLPWFGAAKHKELVLKHNSIISLLNVLRDKDSIGVVKFDNSSPNPVYDYTLSKHDQKSMTMSFEKNLRILVAAGARELYSCQANVKPFRFKHDEESKIDNPRFIQWVETVGNAGIFAVSTPLLSVHQLGSCRMGVTPDVSAVQPSGETWEVKNLYVADGSLLPTAVGVNPMVTIEAVALHVSRNIILSFNESQ